LIQEGWRILKGTQKWGELVTSRQSLRASKPCPALSESTSSVSRQPLPSVSSAGEDIKHDENGSAAGTLCLLSRCDRYFSNEGNEVVRIFYNFILQTNGCTALSPVI
jgi:hypothetical protein